MQEQDTYNIPLYMTSSSTLKPYACKLELNGISCEMDINIGCLSSLISEKQFSEEVIQRLWAYSGKVIIPMGVANLNVKYKGKMYDLRVLLVLRLGPSLLGRDWLESLPINL